MPPFRGERASQSIGALPGLQASGKDSGNGQKIPRLNAAGPNWLLPYSASPMSRRLRHHFGSLRLLLRKKRRALLDLPA
jgi:hypothetical protein